MLIYVNGLYLRRVVPKFMSKNTSVQKDEKDLTADFDKRFGFKYVLDIMFESLQNVIWMIQIPN